MVNHALPDDLEILSTFASEASYAYDVELLPNLYYVLQNQNQD